MATSPYTFPFPAAATYPAPAAGFFPVPAYSPIPSHHHPLPPPSPSATYSPPPDYPYLPSVAVTFFPPPTSDPEIPYPIPVTIAPNWSPPAPPQIQAPPSPLYWPFPTPMCSAAAAPMASSPAHEAAKNGLRYVHGPSPPPATAEIRDEFAHPDPTVGRVNNGSFGSCPASVLEEQARWQRLHLAQADAFHFHSLQPGLINATPTTSTTASASTMRPESTAPAQHKTTPMSAPAKLTTVSKQDPLSCATTSEEQARAEANVRKNMPNAVIDLKRRLDEMQARDRTSFDKLRGELAQLTSMASQLALSISKHTNSALPASSPLRVTGTAPVASTVFDEKPTPSSGYENLSGHPIQSSCVQGGTTNLSEQLLAGMPHHYGFENLKRPSVFLADGSEHNFYALPEDYPLEKATKPMSPTAGTNVGVRVPSSVAAHAADVAPVLGFKSNITAGSDSLFIPSLQLPRNVQEDSLVIKQRPVYGLYEEDTCLNGMEKQKASDNAFSGQPQRSFSKVQKTEQTSNDVSDYGREQEQNGETTSVNVQQLRHPQLPVLVIPDRRKEWDPGVTEFPSLFIPSVGATELQVKDVFKPEFTCSGEPPKLLTSWVNLKKMMLRPCYKLQISTSSKLFMHSLCETISVKEEKDATLVHMMLVLNLEEITAGKDGAALYQVSIIQLTRRNTTHVWNPGIDSLLLVYKGLHTQMIQLVHGSTIHACNLVPTHLPGCSSLDTQFPCFHITAVAAEPNQMGSALLFQFLFKGRKDMVTKWTSTSPNGFLKNSKAKNLLSSTNYLQILEMDILFLTFLPP